MLYRTLLKTHHITSRSKISDLKTSAARLSISVLLKTGRPPGIMIAESSSSENLDAWIEVVKGLRYKDMRVMRGVEEVKEGKLGVGVGPGKLREVGSLKEMGRRLEESGIREWWVRGMGWRGEE